MESKIVALVPSNQKSNFSNIMGLLCRALALTHCWEKLVPFRLISPFGLSSSTVDRKAVTFLLTLRKKYGFTESYLLSKKMEKSCSRKASNEEVFVVLDWPEIKLFTRLDFFVLGHRRTFNLYSSTLAVKIFLVEWKFAKIKIR